MSSVQFSKPTASHVGQSPVTRRAFRVSASKPKDDSSAGDLSSPSTPAKAGRGILSWAARNPGKSALIVVGGFMFGGTALALTASLLKGALTLGAYAGVAWLGFKAVQAITGRGNSGRSGGSGGTSLNKNDFQL